jgi:hypothetical protein
VVPIAKALLSDPDPTTPITFRQYEALIAFLHRRGLGGLPLPEAIRKAGEDPATPDSAEQGPGVTGPGVTDTGVTDPEVKDPEVEDRGVKGPGVKDAATPQHRPMTKKEFANLVHREERNLPKIFADDIHRDRWGGFSTDKGRQLRASFKKGNARRGFTVNAFMESLPGFPPATGWMAFLVYNGIGNHIFYATVKAGKAQVEFEIPRAVTIAACLEDGTTLELDLNTVEGFPQEFYYFSPPDFFRRDVAEIYSHRPPVMKGDIQKNRWGGKSYRKNKLLNARVGMLTDGNFEVTLEVVPDSGNVAPVGLVAFFLPPATGKEIVYSQAEEPGAAATIKVIAAAAFTAGAMTRDGTLLELDLQEIKSFPGDFYYKKKKSTSARRATPKPKKKK